MNGTELSDQRRLAGGSRQAALFLKQYYRGKDLGETVQYVVGRSVQIVVYGEAYPFVRFLPSDLEIFEGCEFGSDILVAVS